jgi:CDP-glucose 4,6-dehydratase
MFEIFRDKKIIVTGHTGFKGSWLAAFLSTYGCQIYGLSKDIPSNPSHYSLLNFTKKIKNYKVDITDQKKIKKIIHKIQPDFVFHLAAQSLVKTSYDDPVLTFKSNSIGTLNILESLRYLKKKCSVILVTSDKSYKNLEIKRGYKETDLLGGEDPYSASKACAELIIQSYIKSYFKNKKILISVGRAGNVIGGGDWSKDRLIPDCFRSWSKKKVAIIRNPKSTRPWQHVIEVVYGYMVLAKKLHNNPKLHGEVFNFGPSYKKNYKVKEILTFFKSIWSVCKWKINVKNTNQKESVLLKLNSTKANQILKWETLLSFKETLIYTLNWYKEYYLNDSKIITIDQINLYKKKIKNLK